MSVFSFFFFSHLLLCREHFDFMFRAMFARVWRVGCTWPVRVFYPLPNFVFPTLSCEHVPVRHDLLGLKQLPDTGLVFVLGWNGTAIKISQDKKKYQIHVRPSSDLRGVLSFTFVWIRNLIYKGTSANIIYIYIHIAPTDRSRAHFELGCRNSDPA